MINKRQKANKELIKNDFTFINMPISSESEDKIGIDQYAKEVKSVIKKGAQSIAITSDFGGGKSSLIKYLESFYCKLTTKFCYVNLWSEISNNDDTKELHKSFIYQLASQISLRKGNYVSKLLSKNYSIFKIIIPTRWATIISFIAFMAFALGIACTTMYETLSKYVDISFVNTHHNKIGVLAFIVAAMLALVFIYKSDMVFPSKKSAEDKELDEHELMDIYKSYICKFHFRHYIVIIEDLDRSNHNPVIKFIKELRRYYIPYKTNNSSNFKCIKYIKKLLLNNINRITFIINIKPESQIQSDEIEESIYAKAFDYVLNLKEISIDNYDIILNKLLKDYKVLFEKYNMPIYNTNGKIKPEFEWVIRGKKLGIREIKNRLNSAISTYVNLCSKFNKKDISIEKCIAASYIVNEFAEEYKKIANIGFDKIIDLYVTNHNVSSLDIMEIFFPDKVSISEEFANEILVLIKNGLISSDYRQYFFNFPSDSYLHSDTENRMTNIILYDQDVSKDKDFPELFKKVIVTNSKVITESLERLNRLKTYYPNCIFYSKELFDVAIEHNKTMVWTTIEEKLPYTPESISTTSKILIELIKNNFLGNQNHLDRLNDILIRKATPQALITFRRLLIENFQNEILCFKDLFFYECPLITNPEVNALKFNTNLLKLVNLDSAELSIDLIKALHVSILSGFNLSNKNTLDNVVDFYEQVYHLLGTTENDILTKYMFEVIKTAQNIHEKFEKLILKNNNANDILEEYIKCINLTAEHHKLSNNTLDNINNLCINSNLSETVCKQLYDSEHYGEFIINACSTNISLIDFSDDQIINTVNSIDYSDKKDPIISDSLLPSIRKQILSFYQELSFKHYDLLFKKPYEIITEEELNLIPDKQKALILIDKEQINTTNCLYIAKYLCGSICTQNESYNILCFVCSISDKETKKAFFSNLDFDKIQYYRISLGRKREIIKQLSDTFDFTDFDDQIAFMKHTKCSYIDFEKEIKDTIENGSFDEYSKEYAEFVKVIKKLSNDTISNLCSLKKIYAMPEHILDKIYANKKYRYYVVSKILSDKTFIFEIDKLNVLSSSYEYVFLSLKEGYKNIQLDMSQNFRFVTYMSERKLYKNASERIRLLFTKCNQTEDNLQDLFDNYDDELCIKYLSEIHGFENYEAASCFVSNMKSRSVVAASKDIYEHTYDKLVNPDLKRNYTRYHKKAISAS